MLVTWLLQGGFLFEAMGKRVVVDAYLSDAVEQKEKLTRLAKPPIKLEQLKPDYWICSHDHLDHLDPPTVEQAAKIYSDCIFVGPASVCEHLRQLGVDDERILSLRINDTIGIDEVELQAVNAVHSDPDAIGLVIKTDGRKYYLTADTLYSDELVNSATNDCDVVFICINGRLGNMNIKEALKVIEEIKPEVAIPMHYGLFAENTADPAEFIKGCLDLNIESFAMQPGVEFSI